ncbi:hypothetical protein BZA70DRAFT_293994 [Myxozyma melibiosi]|uniref:EamA domain-containing protein n=1 Tax=Myxozyma melibiosi TaxID=54550 RepID=A0ABR1F9S0_9ASCO
MADPAKVSLLAQTDSTDGAPEFEDVTSKLVGQTAPLPPLTGAATKPGTETRPADYFDVHSDSSSGANSPVLGAARDFSVETPQFPISGIEPARAGSGAAGSRAVLMGRQAVGSLKVWFNANIGLLLFAVAQLFSSSMNLFTRLLETSANPPFHALQIVFTRMLITMIACTGYMWYRKVPDAPLGPKGIRGLLALRGFTGFFGLFGMYYSLTYLSLSDATVISFLSPTVAGFACSIFLHEAFGRIEFIAGLISFAGVILIAQPGITPPPSSTGGHTVTSAQRWGAVGVAMVGVFGAAGAFTVIRSIGKRAHPLISVNYFAIWCTIISCIALIATPSIGFVFPSTILQWVLLLSIGVCGFLYQFLLTAGLQREKAGRAGNMLYLQMFYAFLFEKLVWNDTPDWMEIAGSGIILGSAVWVAVSKRSSEAVYSKVGSGAISEGPRSPSPEESIEMRSYSRGGVESRV